MVQYVDYKYYEESYKGSSVPKDSFSNIASKASLYVREITLNRVDNNNVAEEVKDAVCAVCDVYYADMEALKKDGGRDVKSVSTDGESATYVTDTIDGQLHEDVLSAKAYKAARPHLIYTGLLYRGCR